MVVSPFGQLALANLGEEDFNIPFYTYDPVQEYMKNYCRRRVYLPVLKHTRSLTLEKTIDSESYHLDTAGIIISNNIILKLPIMKRKVRFSDNVRIHRY